MATADGQCKSKWTKVPISGSGDAGLCQNAGKELVSMFSGGNPAIEAKKLKSPTRKTRLRYTIWTGSEADGIHWQAMQK